MPKTKTSLTAPSKAIDPTLDALFASSSGPVTAPSKDRYVELLPERERQSTKQTRSKGSAAELSDDEEQEDDESLSELEEDEDGVDDNVEEDEEESGSDENEELASQPESSLESSKTLRKDRKRKRRDEHDDLEGAYMRKLAEEEERDDRREKRRKGEVVHESLQKPEEYVDVELDKANRTLFLGNVSIEAVTSSKAKKILTSHLETPLSELDSSTGPHKIESIRFRSTPFSTGAKPKRAAFITKSVMSATTKSTNAYAVYSTPLASRAALKALNGSVILNRHLRVDSVAHPSAVDHRRCVFVGNLGFVDDETVVNTNADGETVTKKRHKVPADTEEGLWRIFGEHAGKIESVRVPRDDKTRVGKGFAYVQFHDENDVESALLLDGKKFPPMLPRALRVSRAKDPRKTALAMELRTQITPEQQSQAGRAGKLFGRSAAAKQQRGLKGDRRKSRDRDDKPQDDTNGIKPPEQFIFEGRRASAKDGKPKDLKFGKTKGKKGAARAKAKGRGARRAAEWRKSKTSCTSTIVPETQPGDYDVCFNCYDGLMKGGRLSSDNGSAGWRRCLRGHRMSVVGYVEDTSGQNRVVIQDIVGGSGLSIEAHENDQALQNWCWYVGGSKVQRLATVDVAVSPPEQQQQHDYPPLPGSPTPAQQGEAEFSIGSHTDFQLFTILWQDNNGGLQVLNRQGQWIRATPIPGTFVVNIADYMQRITNDRYVSTVHRAQNFSGKERISMPFFFGFNLNESCGVLDSCVAEGEEKKYSEISCEEWVQRRARAMHREGESSHK
ncbi:hypothetical protein NUW58_g431 [Xylaria curta]|uniref:Uncharacterized protein n=1 Tax=Xylaria curta TaxID=42375 RepID=A0ACC1PPD7_9PEZI|nr:hypothetical protein NUW58_g431 [Xylaria curta]